MRRASIEPRICARGARSVVCQPPGAVTGLAPRALRPPPLVAGTRPKNDDGTESDERSCDSHPRGVSKGGGLPPSGDLT
jgi:hypothetical protein